MRSALRKTLWITTLFFAAVVVPKAQADTVFSNLTLSTGNGGYDVCGAEPAPGNSPPVPCSQALAQEFTPGGDFTLTDAKVVVGNQEGTSPLFNVWLAQDAGGLPGLLIEQIGFDLSSGGTGGEVTADSIATPIVLTGGTAYWLVLTPSAADTVVYWDVGGLPPSVPFAATHTVDGTGGWFTLQPSSSDHIGGQMEIDGTPFVPAPEPSSVVLLGFGLLLLLSLAARGKCHTPKTSC